MAAAWSICRGRAGSSCAGATGTGSSTAWSRRTSRISAPGRGGYGFALRSRVGCWPTSTSRRSRIGCGSSCRRVDRRRLRQHLESYRVIDDVEVARARRHGAARRARARPRRAARRRRRGARARSHRAGRRSTAARCSSRAGACSASRASCSGRVVAGAEESWPVSKAGDGSGAARAGRSSRARRAADRARRRPLGRRLRRGGGRQRDRAGAEAIDFTKGCYLGQEIVARIFYKGKPSKLFSPLEVRDRATPPAPSSSIHVQTDGGGPGEVCGTLTSVTAGAEPGSWLAIGNVSRRALDEAAPHDARRRGRGGGLDARRAGAGRRS